MSDRSSNESSTARFRLRLERSSRIPSVSKWPLVAVVATLGLIVGFELVQMILPPPAPGEIRTACSLRRFTGVPCPGCGGTRAVKAAAQLDVARALRHNPVVASVFLVAFVVLGVRLLTGFAVRIDLSSTGWILLAVLVVVVMFANWLWVLRQHGFLLGA